METEYNADLETGLTSDDRLILATGMTDNTNWWDAGWDSVRHPLHPCKFGPRDENCHECGEPDHAPWHTPICPHCLGDTLPEEGWWVCQGCGLGHRSTEKSDMETEQNVEA